MDYLVLIPAREQSTRLPGKPLHKIGRKPMIQHTYEAVAAAVPKAKIIILTDSKRIFDECKSFAAQVAITPIDVATGTDRIASFAKTVDCDFFINVQGDEPLFCPNDLTTFLKSCAEERSQTFAGYCKVSKIDDMSNPMIPKVVVGKNAKLIYMSRSPIPGSKKGPKELGFRQVCVYGFTRRALDFYGEGVKKTNLEETEDIELLRLVDYDIPVKMVKLSDKSISVDLLRDVAVVESVFALRARNIRQMMDSCMVHVFDFDGTLVDSPSAKRSEMINLISSHLRQIRVDERDVASFIETEFTVNWSRNKVIKNLFAKFPALLERTSAESINDEFSKIVKKIYIQSEHARKLGQLRSLNKYARWIILSAGNRDEIIEFLEDRNTAELFDDIVCTDNKVDFVLKNSGKFTETGGDKILFFGDSATDLAAADALKANFIFVYGWRDDSLPPVESDLRAITLDDLVEDVIFYQK